MKLRKSKTLLFSILAIICINCVYYLYFCYSQEKEARQYLQSTISKNILYEFERGNFKEVQRQVQSLKNSRFKCLSLSIKENSIIKDGQCKQSYNVRDTYGSYVFTANFTPIFFQDISVYLQQSFYLVLINNIIFLIIFMYLLQQVKLKEQKILFSDNLKNIQIQIAHDIRSPLAALTTLGNILENVPHSQRDILKKATQRINDIANDLSTDRIADQSRNRQTTFIPTLIEEIITEKRLSNKKGGIEIQLEIQADSYNSFSSLVRSDLKRVMSNLITNSIESIKGSGSVTVTLEKRDSINISIIDTGEGINEKHLVENFNKGFTSKKNGQGLGLNHAKKTIEQLGGRIEVASKQNEGSCFMLSLPILRSPSWFTDTIVIYRDVVVIDDDESIHKMWEIKLSQLSCNVSYLRGTNEEIDELYLTPETLLLCDYELTGIPQNGLYVLEKLKHQNAIIITSHFEDLSLQEECNRRGIKIIPKTIIGNIKVKNKANHKVIIDDDPLYRKVKKLQGHYCFSTVNSFLEHKEKFSKDTIIYIDENLKGKSGKKESFRIYNEGFKEIYLQSGDSTISIDDALHIKDCITKK